ncbi:TPA: hypothetical protein RUZ39_003945 [Vibrio cholerae]|nr:hypothetical protein [Vibrio cholerae]
MGEYTVIKGGYYSPHVYFIVAKDVIYIGETQVLPIRRWSSHLDSSGSFSKKLDKYLRGGCKALYMKSISFCSYSCLDELETIQHEYCGYRIPTQALEHKIHEILISEKTFGNDRVVISETLKTAPRQFFHWNEIEIIAKNIVEEAKIKLAL